MSAAVVCIGVFDGVHRGHRALLDRARAEADARGAKVVVITFDPHPLAILRPQIAPARLCTLEERIELLLADGADEVLVVPFTPELSVYTPDAFMDEMLVDRVQAVAVVVGENFYFGHRAAGTTQVLEAGCAARGIDAIVLRLAADAQPWSSTRIRAALEAGDLAEVREVLGRDFDVSGPVVRGDQRGRELGYPTANIQVEADCAVPVEGVYAGWLLHGGHRYPAAISVGTNPHFEGRELRVEAYVLDRTDLDLYGEQVSAVFVERLRGQAVFDGLEALLVQMALDVAAARTLLLG